MHISQKSFLPSFLYDLPVGHDKPLHASLYQTESFQDNANYDKFHHPALCAFPLISLIRESRGGSRCFSWGACCLIEWCWNCNPQPPCFPPFPAVTTSSLLSFHIFPLLEAASPGLAGNGSTNLTWAQKNYVKRLSRAAKWSLCVQKACVSVIWGMGPECEISIVHETTWMTITHTAVGPEREVSETVRLKTHTHTNIYILCLCCPCCYSSVCTGHNM